MPIDRAAWFAQNRRGWKRLMVSALIIGTLTLIVMAFALYRGGTVGTLCAVILGFLFGSQVAVFTFCRFMWKREQ